MDSPLQIWKINFNIKVLCPVIQFHWEKELCLGFFLCGVPPLDKYRQLISTVSRIYLSQGWVLLFGCPVQRGQFWSCIHTKSMGSLRGLHLCVFICIYINIYANIIYINICVTYIQVNIIHEKIWKYICVWSSFYNILKHIYKVSGFICNKRHGI